MAGSEGQGGLTVLAAPLQAMRPLLLKASMKGFGRFMKQQAAMRLATLFICSIHPSWVQVPHSLAPLPGENPLRSAAFFTTGQKPKRGGHIEFPGHDNVSNSI